MHINGMAVRYVGEIHSPNYATHTREFLSVRHAVETLRDLYCGTDQDEIVLWRVDAHDSAGEAYGRVGDSGDASHLLARGPRGGVRVERLR